MLWSVCEEVCDPWAQWGAKAQAVQFVKQLVGETMLNAFSHNWRSQRFTWKEPNNISGATEPFRVLRKYWALWKNLSSDIIVMYCYHSDPYSNPEGGGNAHVSCLPTVNKQQKKNMPPTKKNRVQLVFRVDGNVCWWLILNFGVGQDVVVQDAAGFVGRP